MSDDKPQLRKTQPHDRSNEKVENVSESRSVQDRWHLATTYGVAPEVARSLADDDDVRVLEALASNYSVEPDLLESLANKSPQLRAIVGLNPFARSDLKESVLLREHAALSISRFLDDKRATLSQRSALAQKYHEAVTTENSSVTLAQAWEDALRQ